MNGNELSEIQKSIAELAKETIKKLKEKPIFREVGEILKTKQQNWTRYHKIEHSEEILEEAIMFATADGVMDEEDLEDIGIMAYCHDIGMTERLPKGHEKRGAKMTAKLMEKHGYHPNRIKVVSECIEDTEVIMENGILRQKKARHAPGKYLLDADVGNFGRDDFRQKSDLVFEEMQVLNPQAQLDKKQFLLNTLAFISNHNWQSEPARQFRQAKQMENTRLLEVELSKA